MPRDALWFVLSKFGLPSHFIRLVTALHSDFFFRVDCGLTFRDILAGVGVKQGDSLPPVLFNVYFHACMEVLDARWTASKPSFCHDEDCVLTDRRASQEGTLESDYCKSLYADDGAFVFTERADIVSHLPLIYDTLADFGLIMHIGRGIRKARRRLYAFLLRQILLLHGRRESGWRTNILLPLHGRRESGQGTHIPLAGVPVGGETAYRVQPRPSPSRGNVCVARRRLHLASCGIVPMLTPFLWRTALFISLIASIT